MDLSTGHLAYTTHTQDAHRLERELEYRRIAKERAAESAAASTVTTAVAPRRSRGLFALHLFRSHRAAAQ